jgi:hypothetical protein
MSQPPMEPKPKGNGKSKTIWETATKAMSHTAHNYYSSEGYEYSHLRLNQNPPERLTMNAIIQSTPPTR